MTAAVKAYLEILRKREYRDKRSHTEMDMTALCAGKDSYTVQAISYREMLKHEKPVIFENDPFGFNRSEQYYPYRIENGKKAYCGNTGNITPDYAAVIAKGFDRVLAFVREAKKSKTGTFYDTVECYLTDTLLFCERYRKQAEKMHNTRLAEALERVPAQPATTFYEACLFLKIILFSLRCAHFDHLTLGRFDQYMAGFFEQDRNNGVSEEELLETLEFFFISLNFDTDTYSGVQQGDNGQSMVLGGFDRFGNSCFNELSKLCLTASTELGLIDPKINLRVGKNTPPELYEWGTKLTKKGLGFPQYCNDDVVVPGLCRLGYDPEDAWNYTVAACWEFIVPNCSADIPNLATMNFPLVVDRVITEKLAEAESFEQLLDFVLDGIRQETDNLMAENFGRGFTPSAALSVYVDGCLESGNDLSQNAAKYNCSGCHGAGIANAADALAAVKQTVFEEKTITARELLAAKADNFEGSAAIRNRLLACPKMGNNDDAVDTLAGLFMQTFADEMNGKPNGRPAGFWRAGTGSAMEYIWSAKKCPATADGRRAAEPYGSSFSPSITARLNGPLSVIQSFTKFDMKQIINGGPLTMEIHDTVFRNPQGEQKVAMLVKEFIDLGGHQLQLNAINRERLKQAQAYPENDPNLIVRVWGWSGYFCELDKEYQDHIIRRTEFSL